MVHTPDGMGADRYHERQNMKEAARSPPPFTHDIVAVDIAGNVLYETESFYSAEEATEALDSYDVVDAPPEVDAFTVRERQ